MLPETVTGWNVRHVAQGVALTPPDGGGGGGVRIRERLPLQTTAQIIDEATAQMQGFDSVEVEQVEVLTTYEGEYAALWTMIGTRGTLRLERTIAAVWGDFHCTRIDGATDDPSRYDAFRGAVRDLCYYHALGLGERRRRRFLFTPPPAWQGYARGLVGLWIPPGYPARDHMIRVFPAHAAGTQTPASALDRQLHEMSWAGFEQERAEKATPAVNDDGLSGVARRLVGRFRGGSRRFIDVTVLQDQRYYYPLRCDSFDHDSLVEDAFAATVRSVKRLPAPVAVESSAFLSHWSE